MATVHEANAGEAAGMPDEGETPGSKQNEADFHGISGAKLEEEAKKLMDGATMLMAPCKVHIHQERLNSMVSWVACCLQTIETALVSQQDMLGRYGKRLEFLEGVNSGAAPQHAAPGTEQSFRSLSGSNQGRQTPADSSQTGFADVHHPDISGGAAQGTEQSDRSLAGSNQNWQASADMNQAGDVGVQHRGTAPQSAGNSHRGSSQDGQAPANMSQGDEANVQHQGFRSGAPPQIAVQGLEQSHMALAGATPTHAGSMPVSPQGVDSVKRHLKQIRKSLFHLEHRSPNAAQAMQAAATSESSQPPGHVTIATTPEHDSQDFVSAPAAPQKQHIRSIRKSLFHLEHAAPTDMIVEDSGGGQGDKRDTVAGRSLPMEVASIDAAPRHETQAHAHSHQRTTQDAQGQTSTSPDQQAPTEVTQAAVNNVQKNIRNMRKSLFFLEQGAPIELYAEDAEEGHSEEHASSSSSFYDPYATATSGNAAPQFAAPNGLKSAAGPQDVSASGSNKQIRDPGRVAETPSTSVSMEQVSSTGAASHHALPDGVQGAAPRGVRKSAGFQNAADFAEDDSEDAADDMQHHIKLIRKSLFHLEQEAPTVAMLALAAGKDGGEPFNLLEMLDEDSLPDSSVASQHTTQNQFFAAGATSRAAGASQQAVQAAPEQSTQITQTTRERFYPPGATSQDARPASQHASQEQFFSAAASSQSAQAASQQSTQEQFHGDVAPTHGTPPVIQHTTSEQFSPDQYRGYGAVAPPTTSSQPTSPKQIRQSQSHGSPHAAQNDAQQLSEVPPSSSPDQQSPSKAAQGKKAKVEPERQQVQNTLMTVDNEALRLSSQQGDLQEISEDQQFGVSSGAVWPVATQSPHGSQSSLGSPLGSFSASRNQSRGEMSSRGKLVKKMQLDHQEKLRIVEDQVRGDVQALADVVQSLQHDLSLRIDDLFEKLRGTARQSVVEATGFGEPISADVDHKMMASTSGSRAGEAAEDWRGQMPTGRSYQVAPDATDSAWMPNLYQTSSSEPPNFENEDDYVSPRVNISGLDESVFVSKPNFESALRDIRGDMDDQLRRLCERFESVQKNIETKIGCSKCPGGAGAVAGVAGAAPGSDQLAAFVYKPLATYTCACCGSPVSAAQMRWRTPAPRSSHNFFPARSTLKSEGDPETSERRLQEKMQHQMALNEAQRAFYLPTLGDQKPSKDASPKKRQTDEEKKRKLEKQLSLPDLSPKNQTLGIVNIGLDLPQERLNLFKHNSRVWSPRFQARKTLDAIKNA